MPGSTRVALSQRRGRPGSLRKIARAAKSSERVSQDCNVKYARCRIKVINDQKYKGLTVAFNQQQQPLRIATIISLTQLLFVVVARHCYVRVLYCPVGRVLTECSVRLDSQF